MLVPRSLLARILSVIRGRPGTVRVSVTCCPASVVVWVLLVALQQLRAGTGRSVLLVLLVLVLARLPVVLGSQSMREILDRPGGRPVAGLRLEGPPKLVRLVLSRILISDLSVVQPARWLALALALEPCRLWWTAP
jgi:hypothetical protein